MMRPNPQEVREQLAVPHPVGGGILNDLVKDFCPAGAGMYYATEQPCGGCPLIAACIQIHRDRLARARAAGIMAQARQFEKFAKERRN